MMMEIPLFMKIYIAVLCAIIGMCFASFSECAASRKASGKSVLKGRSVCDSCGHSLGVFDLIPVFSYLFLGGKCRYCKKKIPAFSTVAEIISAVACASVFLKFGFTLDTVQYLLLVLILIYISCYDYETMEIPFPFIIAGIVIRIVFILLSGDIKNEAIQSAIGAVCVTIPLLIVVLIFEKIKKKEAMGGGDIKLFFMLGMYFHWTENLCLVIFACIIGIIMFLIMSKVNDTKDVSKPMPFGPSIALAAWLTLLVAEPLITWYSGFLK